MTVAKIVATWFGSGLLRPAPGTWGSLAALPFAWAIATFGGAIGLLAAAAALFPIGVWAAARFDAANDSHDASEIVIDEVAGIWVAVAFVPPDWIHYLAGFLLFRLFDIVKPWPIRWLDRNVEGGLGVMLDDLAAGAAAALSLWLIEPILTSSGAL